MKLKKKKILVNYYNDYNDLDYLSLVEKINTKNAFLLSIMQYAHARKTIINDYLYNCLILGFQESYSYSNDYNLLLNNMCLWKIPLSQVELDGYE